MIQNYLYTLYDKSVFDEKVFDDDFFCNIVDDQSNMFDIEKFVHFCKSG